MKLKTLTLGLVTFVTLGSASAFAAPPDVARTQLDAKSALTGFKFNLSGEQATFNSRGRRDLVMFTNRDHAAVVGELQSAYENRRMLPNGYHVAGWAHLVATDSYTFTLRSENNDQIVAEVFKDPQGARVQIWGAAHNIYAPVHSTRTDLPSRFKPVRGSAIVR